MFLLYTEKQDIDRKFVKKGASQGEDIDQINKLSNTSMSWNWVSCGVFTHQFSAVKSSSLEKIKFLEHLCSLSSSDKFHHFGNWVITDHIWEKNQARNKSPRDHPLQGFIEGWEYTYSYPKKFISLFKNHIVQIFIMHI